MWMVNLLYKYGQDVYWAVALSGWALFCRNGFLSWSLNAWTPWNGDWDPFFATQSERAQKQVQYLVYQPTNFAQPRASSSTTNEIKSGVTMESLISLEKYVRRAVPQCTGRPS